MQVNIMSILSIVGQLCEIAQVGQRLGGIAQKCLDRKRDSRERERLILEEVPRERSYIGGNLIIPYNNKAFLLLHIQARNPMSETVYIYEVKVECRDKAKNLIRTELVKPLESLPDIVAKEKVLD